MRLLIYSHYFAPSIGGVEIIVMSLAKGLAEARRDGDPIVPTVVTEIAGTAQDDSALPFRVIRKPSLTELFSLIKNSDLVHVAGPALAPMALSYLLGKPYVVEHHGYQANCPNGLLILQPQRTICPGHFQQREYLKCVSCRAVETSRLKAWFSVLAMFPRRYLSSRAAVNIGVSQHVIDRDRLPNSRLILHGIDVAPPSKPSSRRAQTVFGFVGRFVPEKGIPVLLQACAILKSKQADFKLRMVGDGPERRVAEQMIAELKLEEFVEITGFRSGAALEAALEDVGVLVMPSVWEEAAGLSAMEVMMRGRLVIASAVGGLGEMVGDAGLLVAVNDPESLSLAMLKIIQNPHLLEAIGQKARDRAVKFFSRQRMINEHSEVYASLASGD